MDLDNLDALDRGLLHALQVDGRATFSLLGDVLGVSDQTVARRLARLEQRRALRVRGITNPAVVGGVSWLLRVRATPEAAGEVANALARRPDTSWISLCSGGTEILAMADGPDVASLLLDALPRTRQVIDVQADEIMHVFYGGPSEPFTKHGPLDADQVSRIREHVPRSSRTPEPLDDTDLRLVRALHEDGRASMEALALTTALSIGTVRRRLGDLRAEGVLCFTVDVELGVFDLPTRTLLRLTVDVGDLDRAGRQLAEHPGVAFAAAVTGQTNMFASVSSSSPAALFRYLTQDVAKLPGLRNVQSTASLRNVKSFSTQYSATRTSPGSGPGRRG